MNPTFSVIVPLYNHEGFVSEAIQSVLQQSLQDFELIVIDDGSTDNSADEVAKFDDPRISYHYQQNQGAHIALNKGIDLARGTFVAILNSDDTFHPDRLKHALQIFNEHPTIGAYFSAYDFIDASSNIVRFADEILKPYRPLPSALETDNSPVSQANQWILSLLSGNFFHSTSNLILKRDLFDSVGKFKPWRYVHDFDFFLHLCLQTDIFFDERALWQYRFHGNNTLAENGVRSVYETMLVIAGFFNDWQPFASDAINANEAAHLFSRFYSQLRLYGGDRLLLALTLTQYLLRNDDKAGENFLAEITDNKKIYQLVSDELTASIQQNNLHEDLEWQKSESQRWWEKSQCLETDLAWQKSETDKLWIQNQQLVTDLEKLQSNLDWQKDEADKLWKQNQQLIEEVNQLQNDLTWQKGETDNLWEQNQKLKNDFAWQKSETDKLWEQNQQLENDLRWQKGETDRWWQRSQQVETALDEANKFLGLSNLQHNCKQKLFDLFKNSDT